MGSDFVRERRRRPPGSETALVAPGPPDSDKALAARENLEKSVSCLRGPRAKGHADFSSAVLSDIVKEEKKISESSDTEDIVRAC